MDEEVFNMQLRKFLKHVGVTSQREVEQAVRAAVDDGRLKPNDTVKARMTLTIDALGIKHEIDGKIALS